jgi:hypothetical protein
LSSWCCSNQSNVQSSCHSNYHRLSERVIHTKKILQAPSSWEC